MNAALVGAEQRHAERAPEPLEELRSTPDALGDLGGGVALARRPRAPARPGAAAGGPRRGRCAARPARSRRPRSFSSSSSRALRASPSRPSSRPSPSKSIAMRDAARHVAYGRDERHGSAELRDVYEAQYATGRAARRSGAWRELCARGKADHVLDARGGAAGAAGAIVAELGCGDGVLLRPARRRGLRGAAPRLRDLRAGRGARRGAAGGRPGPALRRPLAPGRRRRLRPRRPLARARARARPGAAAARGRAGVPGGGRRGAARGQPLGVAARRRERGREAVGHLHRFARADVRALVRGARACGSRPSWRDPLPASGARCSTPTASAQRARALARRRPPSALRARADDGRATRSRCITRACCVRTPVSGRARSLAG